ncbi:MATE family efflux transporter [Pokkaliibacter sp. CJK22405]|uniref:MATE family efflux transporter n=1 Tax=Pokkaliibacter sp. CJK22405 TaxID=3384615 RepID=UPI0039851FC4
MPSPRRRHVISPRAIKRYKTLLGLGLPIMAGMLSQSLMNLVDSALVGHLGEIPLAAVGTGSYLQFLATAFIMGLTSAVQANIAQHKGAGDSHLFPRIFASSLLLGLLVAILISTTFIFCAASLSQWVAASSEVAHATEPYLFWRLIGLPGVVISLAVRGVLHGTQKPTVFLFWLALSHLLNALLSWTLIYGKAGMPALGVEGAGLGTTLAVYFSAAGLFISQSKHLLHPLPKVNEWLNLKLFWQLAKYWIPQSLQQLSLSLSLAVFFTIIGTLGNADQAIAHVLINLSLLLILPGVGLGMASTTLVGQAIGQGEIKDAYRWGKQSVKLASIILLVLALPLICFPERILDLFLDSPELIAIAAPLLVLTALMMVADSASLVLNHSLYGAGIGQLSMWIAITTQWGFLLPLAWFAGPILGGGLLGIWVVQFLQRGLNSSLYLWIWKRQHRRSFS